MLRPTVSWSVYLGVKPHLGFQDQTFVTCGFIDVGAPSLTRGSVCRLQLRLVLASVDILGSSPAFTVSDSRLFQPGGPGRRIYIPQEQDGPVILPGTGFFFYRLLRLAGLRWWYSKPPPYGELTPQSESQNYFTTCGLPQISLSWRQAP
jgi:hypothetical protein